MRNQQELVNLQLDIIEWMDSALSLIEELREENFKLRFSNTQLIPETKIEIREVIKEVIKEVPVNSNSSLIFVSPSDFNGKICRCGRMQLRKGEWMCDLCLGSNYRKRIKVNKGYHKERNIVK